MTILELLEATVTLRLRWEPHPAIVVERDLDDGRTAYVALMTYGKARIGVGKTGSMSVEELF